MGIAPLCILQMRYASTRIPAKMLLPLGGETLAARGYWNAVQAFGYPDVVVACPRRDVEQFEAAVTRPLRAAPRIFGWDGPEWDVLGRFYHCAHTYRWHPDSVIVRWTPDDPFKDTALCRRVADGERLPVETSCEAFTLAQLDAAYERESDEVVQRPQGGGMLRNPFREHITDALFPFRLPPTGVPGDTIDTQADYEAALRRLEQGP